MAINKKAYYFSIIILILLSLVVLIFNSNTELGISKDSNVKEERVKFMNNHLKKINKDLEQALFISSFRAILDLTNEFIAKGKFIPSNEFESQFEALVINGTFYGVSKNGSFSNDSNLVIYASRLTELSKDFAINLTINFTNASIYQNDPWYVTVSAKYDVVMIDETNPISWNTSFFREAELPITLFEDPVYTIGTLGRVRKYNKTEFTQFRNPLTNNTTNLTNHTASGFYFNNINNSPSFLQRLQNNFSAVSQHGIESLIDVEDLDPTLQKNKSIRDWIYFRTTDPPNTQIQGMPDWFRLDNITANNSGEKGNLDIYQIENFTR